MYRKIIGVVTLTAALSLSACGDGNEGTSAAMDEIQALAAQLTALEAEAALIKDSNDIKRLQRTYGFYLDAQMWDEMADMFTEDGTFEIGLDGVYVGRERVRAYFYALGGGRAGIPRGRLAEHFQLQAVVNVADDGQTARARWRGLIMSGTLGESAIIGEGPYEITYRKVDAIWHIQSVHWYNTYRVNYEDGGWAKNPDASGGKYVSHILPPDLPPTEVYETWPSVYFPPFHYANPVTGRATGAGYEFFTNPAQEGADHE